MHRDVLFDHVKCVVDCNLNPLVIFTFIFHPFFVVHEKRQSL